MGQYLTAEVCPNGHHTTASVENSPELQSKHCPECGEATFTTCQECGVNIRGYYRVPGVLSLSTWQPPNFCYSCGKPYPWTALAVTAAEELADELDGLTEDEKASLKKSIVDLTKDTPRTQLASVRYKKLISKAGAAGAAALNDIIVSLATEAAKKHLGL